MTETTAGGSDALSSARLEQFTDEVARLRVTGGTANPERLGATWGVALLAVGGIAAIVGLVVALGGNTEDKLDGLAIILTGSVAAVIGLALWMRNSMTRYLRFWLVRLVYEQREQADRVVDAAKR
ncbi:MAG: hypothetical protein ACT4OX_01455 [Actinomycetota bacterium]